MPARKLALVVDANNLISRCIFASALDDLRAGGIFTGGIYGSIASLRALLTNPLVSGVGRIFAFFDNGVPPHRMKALPDYKQARREAREQLDEDQREKALGQILRCYELWPLLGICCLSYKEREADDGVAAACRLLWTQGHQPIVVSSDRDLFQMVAHGAWVYDLRSQELITRETFEEHSDGIPLDKWLVYRALVGDSSDGIKGAPGCGPKRAKQLLDEIDFTDLPFEHDKLAHLCATVRERVRDAKKPRAFEQAVIDSEDHLQNVLRAIDLSDSFGPVGKLSKRMCELPSVDTKSFLRHCRELQFASILGDPSGTIDPFLAAQKRRS